jgi:O-succinylbenzoic acid--CoA ligase
LGTVLLGGAPAWESLFQAARKHRIQLAPTYGMTETASQIATLKPEVFLSGKTSCGSVLPHANVEILASDVEEANLTDSSAQSVGEIAIQADSLALGYYPNLFGDRDWFRPGDLGFFDAQGSLQVVGRSDRLIITGGENVFPAEVESAIRSTGLVTDICVLGLPDQTWGEAVTAVYVPRKVSVTADDIREQLQGKLSRYKLPKAWIPVIDLPHNPQGKVDMNALRKWIERSQQII